MVSSRTATDTEGHRSKDGLDSCDVRVRRALEARLVGFVLV